VLREVLEELLEALTSAADQPLAELDRVLGDGTDDVAELTDEGPELVRRDAEGAEQAVDDRLGRVLGELDERGRDLGDRALGLLAQIGDLLADLLDGAAGAIDQVLVDALWV
jgi:hypothetical protein